RAGEILYSQGCIDLPRDVFWLKKDEAFGITDALDMKKIIAERKRDYAVFEKLPAFSRIIFDGKAFDKHHVGISTDLLADEFETLHGTPCSDGTVTGEAVVINDINNPPSVAGKIIVARMTDPGWVFFLTSSIGIISEKGSLLSHTAIISRELKIPAVVGVKNAASLIKTGDIITLDGKKGRIEIITRHI
ncbi:MAG: PEP-utilizing enzyme, partial [Oscillospiraceae bacterium]